MVLTLLLGARPGQAAGNPSPGVSPPNAKAFGKSYSDWSAEWWKWSLKIDTAVHPSLGGACTEGQSGKVFYIAADFLGGSGVPCTIPAGKAIFVAIVNSECSTVEPPPFHGDNEEELTDCATCWGDHIVPSSVQATLDGVPLKSLTSYRALSPMFPFVFPASNIFGIPGPGSGLSVSDGYWLMIPPLSAGVHTLSFSGAFDFPDGDEGCDGSGGGFSFGFGGDFVLTVKGGK